MKIEKVKFSETKDKKTVYSYKLINSKIEIEILNYGGIIKSINFPDRNGKKENIVLSYDNLESYTKDVTYFGCITGRVAGRIKNGILKINEENYQLELNNNKNNLHGGFNALNNKVWDVVSEEIGNDFLKIVMCYRSPHMENNFPANVEFTVSYTLRESTLEIDYIGVPDRETYINLTNHTYFNLSGDAKRDILDQKIFIFANEYISVDEEIIPVEILPVMDSVFDLTKGRKFKEIFNSQENQIKIVGNGIDHGFILDKKHIKKCRCEDIESGRILEIETDQPVVVLYTGNYLENTDVLASDIKPHKYYGFCLETQDYPDIKNLIEEKMEIYNSSNPYIQKTKYSFKIN
ncbi:galactose mutarotase [Cetobacterium somerae]|uniref:aldose epimerase family protein n=1 Tax=Cetobacterium sp. NK01 TaxID=2993530 RepID=UPI0021161948|nr:aldose epimerase family protein [Cetobacterium sp. NK01]MCQ8211036.1 galactose mutarotase [Cetobacterium sp. NK01]